MNKPKPTKAERKRKSRRKQNTEKEGCKKMREREVTSKGNKKREEQK